jgi:hypothetical protein
MTFAKPTKYETIDDRNPSLCTVPGCTNLWSVKIDSPKCSFHQWNTDSKPRAKPLPQLKEKTVAQWYDEKDKDIF